MSVAELKFSGGSGARMDRQIARPKWHPAGWPLAARIGAAGGAGVLAVLVLTAVFFGSGTRTTRLPAQQVTIAPVEPGTFHDLIPLRSKVVPRETIYIDAIDGGRVDRVLVQAGDVVQAGQPLIELSNTNLQLQVIQQESQLNQAIANLQQNEITLEQQRLANDKALAEIDFNITRLGKSAERRESLLTKGAASAEQRDQVSDELAHYRRLRPIQAESSQRQGAMRDRLLPDIRDQLGRLRGNLQIVGHKLDALIIRAPVAGRVTDIDLKVGENRNPGQRLAEVTPDSGVKMSADIDEFYLARVRKDQFADIDLGGKTVKVKVARVYPQVREGRFMVDLDFVDSDPTGLVAGQTAQGRLQLGNDTQALILKNGPFMEQSGGDWVFVLASDGNAAEKRRIKIGRRTIEQLEVLSGLAAGDKVVISDYAGLDRTDRLVLTR